MILRLAHLSHFWIVSESGFIFRGSQDVGFLIQFDHSKEKNLKFLDSNFTEKYAATDLKDPTEVSLLSTLTKSLTVSICYQSSRDLFEIWFVDCHKHLLRVLATT